MFSPESVQSDNNAVLVHLLENGDSFNSPEEFVGLSIASGASVVDKIDVNVRFIDPKLFIGSGKASQIAQLVEKHNPDLVIFNCELSPSQERNLEKHVKCRVIDRTRLILDIFAQRAKSHEGKLQVELAQLDYLSTRLVRGWTHLERQKGGIGLRGPGETQLESDRRMLATRVDQLKKQLARVGKRRDLSRAARQTARVPVVALAGYTNAGKTSLFNALCEDSQFVANQLFASLDTTLRRIALPGMRQAVLVDTVGFVENLPHQLVESFASTLEEVVQASLVLHVCDASNEKLGDKINAVSQVLRDIGAAEIPQLVVWNKCDLLQKDAINLPRTIAFDDKLHDCVEISVENGHGLDDLRGAIAAKLTPSRVKGWFVLAPDYASKNRAFLYKIGAVIEEKTSPLGEILVELDMDASLLAELSGVKEVEKNLGYNESASI